MAEGTPDNLCARRSRQGIFDVLNELIMRCIGECAHAAVRQKSRQQRVVCAGSGGKMPYKCAEEELPY